MARWLTSSQMVNVRPEKTGWLDVHMARSPDRQKSTWPEVQIARRTVSQKARYLDEYMVYIKYIKQIPIIGVASATPLTTWFFTPIFVWNFFIEFETVLNTFPLAQIEMLCLLPLTYSFCHWMLSQKMDF